jgi:hypothetical protein
MEKDNINLVESFEQQVKFIFEDIKKLPNYGQAFPTYIAQLRAEDSADKIRQVLQDLSKDITVESTKATRTSHVIRRGDEFRIVIIYAQDSNDLKWLYDFHSYSNSIIVGKMLKKVGLKYSEDGLQYIQHDLRPNHQSIVGTLDITKNLSRVLEILELDYQEFMAGFKNTDEIFSFFVKSPYLKVEKFISTDKEQRNFTLQRFEEYLILHKIENQNPKSLEFDRIKELFPEIDFTTKISELVAKAELKQSRVDKFNGRLILDKIPGFEPKKIGISMGYFKHSFESIDAFHDFLSNHTEDEIIEKFKEVNKI